MSSMSKQEQGFGTVEAMMILFIVVFIGAIGWVVYLNHHKKVIASAASSAAANLLSGSSPISDVCFLQDSVLSCVNAQGQKPHSYTVPLMSGSPVSYLVPNDTDTQYVADTGSLWLLSDRLATIKQLVLPSGLRYNPGTISWSHNGKSLFMELDNISDSRQIYQYDIANGAVTQLTYSGSNTYPYQTSDGDIIYINFSGTSTGSGDGWMPYIMNANGSNAEPLSALAPAFMGLSYDSATDTVFVDNVGTDSTSPAGTLYYETAGDIVNGAAPKSIPLDNVQESGNSQVLRVNSDAITWVNSVSQNDTNEQFIRLSDGTVEYTSNVYGIPVGVLPNIGLLK